MTSPTPGQRLDFARKVFTLTEEAIVTQRGWVERLGPETRSERWSSQWRAELRFSIQRMEGELAYLRAAISGLESELAATARPA